MNTISRSQRDVLVIGIIGLVHLLSHAYQFTLAPLFPFIAGSYEQGGIGVSYTQLGLLASLFFASSGLFQTPAGFLVDRIGARPVLICGLGILSLSVFCYSLAPNYAFLALLSIIAGIGNSVFHPADYSLINGAVSKEHLGKAYSAHSVGGYIGFAIAPAALPLIEPLLGWRGAVAIAGGIGITVALFLLFWKPNLNMDSSQQLNKGSSDPKSLSAGLHILIQPTILLGFFFFFILAMGLIGFKTMGPTALHEGWQFSVVFSGNAIAAFSTAGVLGIALGGIWADRSENHNQNAVRAFSLSGVFLLVIPVVPNIPVLVFALLIIAGLFFGFALPSRDLFIRSLTPPGASGRVFGFVYCGLDVGASLTPILFGWLMDGGRAELVFIAAGCLILFSAAVISITDILVQKLESGSGS